MQLMPIAIGAALALASLAVWLLISAWRHRRRWNSLGRLIPALALLYLVVMLASYIFGLNAPHPFFNRSAPVPASTVIYYMTGSFVGNSQSSPTLIAIQGQSGKILWQRKLSAPASSLATFTVDGDVLYSIAIVSHDSVIRAYSMSAGVTLWQETLPGTYIDRAPLLAGGVLYLSVSLPSTSTSPGAFTFPRAELLALRPADGKQLWSVPLLFDGFYSDAPTIAATNDILIAQYGMSGFQALRLRDGAVLWDDSPINGAFVMGSNAIYELSSNGSLVARNDVSGATLWKFGDHDVFHHGLVSGDTLYVTAQRNGPVTDSQGALSNPETLYALNTTSGSLRWSFATQSANAATLAAGSDTILIQADDGIHALRTTDGAVRWKSDPSANWSLNTLFVSPSIVDPVLYVSGLQTLPATTLVPSGQQAQVYLYAVNEADGTADWGSAIGPVVTIMPNFFH